MCQSLYVTNWSLPDLLAAQQGSVISLNSGNTVFLPNPTTTFDSDAKLGGVRLEMSAFSSVNRRFADLSGNQACVSDFPWKAQKLVHWAFPVADSRILSTLYVPSTEAR